jgi:DNA-binding beta-propeller fold protein YncE
LKKFYFGLFILFVSTIGMGCKNNAANSPGSHSLDFTLYGSTPGPALSAPSGICVDGNNNLYVADTGNHRILKYDSNGNWLLTIQGPFNPAPPAGQPDQFNQPEDVSVDNAGNIYVSDADQISAPEIFVFSSTGSYITNWGNGGGNAQLNQPSQLTVLGGQVYVADAGNNRIAYFSTAGAYNGEVGGIYGSNLGELHSPDGVAVDGSGNIYAGDRGNSRIEVFTSSGSAVSIWGMNQTGSFRLAFDLSGNLWVVNISPNELSEFSTNGSLVQTWSPDGYSDVSDVAFDNTGAVWVSFVGNGVELPRVEKFSH